MSRKMSRWLIFIMLWSTPISLLGQGQVDLVTSSRQRALQELESILVQTNDLTDRLAYVEVRAKAASLLWFHDPSRAQMIFRELWRQIEEHTDSPFDQEAARTALLENLFPRDRSMARSLLEKAQGGHKSEEALYSAQIAGTDQNLKRLARLSSTLVEQDTAMAAALLERSLSVSVSPAALFTLFRLREKEPHLADYIAARTLETLKARPTVIALPGVYVLADYVFPSVQGFGNPITRPPDPSLRMQYVSTAYEILQKSLAESESMLQREEKYTQKDLRFRRIYQGQVAALLSALAPRYMPEHAQELSHLAANLTKDLPSETIRLLRLNLARISGRLEGSENAEIAISAALAGGRIDEAKQALERLSDENMKRAFAQAIANVEFRSHLARGDLAGALIVARRIEDPNIRGILYAQVARAAYQKGEVNLSRLIIVEARVALSAPESSGMRVRTLLSLASEASVISASDATQLLWDAVSVLNTLKVPPQTGAAVGSLPQRDDPRSFRNSVELWRAFSSVGHSDLDGTLWIANQIREESVRLVARLAACHKWLMGTEEPSMGR
jgi:hypothetical protein